MSNVPPYVLQEVIDGSHLVSPNRLADPILRISVYTGDNNYRKNYIFDSSWIINSGWCDSMALLYSDAMAHGIELGTDDVVPLEEADVILFINLPSSRSVVADVRSRFPAAKLVLIASESPVVQPHARVIHNHDLFDLVLLHSVDGFCSSKYKPLPLGCAYIPECPPPFTPYCRRRFAILVNSNVNTGMHRLPRPWHVFNTLTRIRRSGWSLPFSRFVHVSFGSRYHIRREFARSVESLGIQDFDIYGTGWEPLRSGWLYRLFPEKPFYHARGLLKSDKLLSLCNYKFAFCYENYAGSEGYISEKIFDALAAGTVPLCHGDTSLKRIIPSSCVIFRDDYSSDRAMLSDLLGWDESRWLSYYHAGQEYLHSDALKPFLPEAYATNVLRLLLSLV
ncbi:MAG: glycosyltransferase family 10 domain-containing protein [Sphaerospermopsis kisseleviana]